MHLSISPATTAVELFLRVLRRMTLDERNVADGAAALAVAEEQLPSHWLVALPNSDGIGLSGLISPTLSPRSPRGARSPRTKSTRKFSMDRFVGRIRRTRSPVAMNRYNAACHRLLRPAERIMDVRHALVEIDRDTATALFRPYVEDTREATESMFVAKPNNPSKLHDTSIPVILRERTAHFASICEHLAFVLRGLRKLRADGFQVDNAAVDKGLEDICTECESWTQLTAARVKGVLWLQGRGALASANGIPQKRQGRVSVKGGVRCIRLLLSSTVRYARGACR